MSRFQKPFIRLRLLTFFYTARAGADLSAYQNAPVDNSKCFQLFKSLGLASMKDIKIVFEKPVSEVLSPPPPLPAATPFLTQLH